MPSATVERILNASRQRVFAAWTDPTVMSRWFFAEPDWTAIVSNDLRIGGTYRIQMQPPDRPEFVAFGEYLEIEPISKLVFTWNSPLVQHTRVTIALEEFGEKTGFKLTHELFSDAETARRDGGGWQGCLNNLVLFLETATAPP
jgi:uncharacterized protein YndB with AHSA1/START domain